jgi:hypothetical protein
MSRILDKPELIKILKEVTTKLEVKSIRYEIPFMFKEKTNFDHIRIVIPQETDISTLQEILSSDQFELKGRFINFYYKDFRIVFIRATETEFFTTFFYYSWDIVPTLMNVMFNKMGMDLTPLGLRYVASSNTFIISNNIRHIIEFLDLDFDDYMKRGFNSLFDEISFITTSAYFNPKIFKEYVLNKNDFFYNENLPILEYALKEIDNFNCIDFIGYDYEKDLDSYLMKIDNMFPDSKFIENVTRAKFAK